MQGLEGHRGDQETQEREECGPHDEFHDVHELENTAYVSAPVGGKFELYKKYMSCLINLLGYQISNKKPNQINIGPYK